MCANLEFQYPIRLPEKEHEVTESAAVADLVLRKVWDTLYLGGVEVHSRLKLGATDSRWFTRSICEVAGAELLALVEDTNTDLEPLIGLQIGQNMELEPSGLLITYEEYSPFGTVMYTARHGQVEAPRKYRFARYEHDAETGLYHCGARYYCPWLGRWTSPDPLEDVDGPKLYQYVGNDPVNMVDHSGTASTSFSRVGRDLVRNQGTDFYPPGKAAIDVVRSKTAVSSLKKIVKDPNTKFGALQSQGRIFLHGLRAKEHPTDTYARKYKLPSILTQSGLDA
ncbi:tRNA3(Ser)-specific nuclease WapA [Colletotrichum liriopes]|uniref:tRNA3(Ser)-specific nuclease WapA n=1 Tax=Colletotrichum liriopes TaxID=708192 RepID=A0AA37H1K9_9PEZI|nr:tRNA3(Ser)-specific nuclease WapA [Colletotrichum liriopes]